MEKEPLKTIEDMKRESLNFLNDQSNSYDLDEKINFLYIKGILDSKKLSNQNKIKAFNEIQYKLAYEDRHSLLINYKNLFSHDETIKSNPYIRQNDKLKLIFISLLKDIINGESSAIRKLFLTKYYVPLQSSKIPFIYGSEEYIFANLINDAYDTFIVKSNYPKKWNDKEFNEYKDLSSYINRNAIKPTMKPTNIFEKPDKITFMELEDDTKKEDDKKRHYLVKSKFIAKKAILEPILKIYTSTEFQRKYEENLLKNPDKRVKYIYEIIIESLFFYCLNFNEIKKIKIINEFKDIFYEYEKEKMNALKIHEFDLRQIKDSYGNVVDISKGLENRVYKVKIYDFDIDLNFYDYNIKKLMPAFMKLEDIPENNRKQYIDNVLDNCEYWTIQKYATVNSLYNHDSNLNKLFDEELDLMLKHKVLENVFDEISLFSNYQYPFLNMEFLKQVHNSIVYVKLPTKLIIGLTIKNMGVIIINKGRYDEVIEEQNNKNIKFALKLSEFSFYKVTLVHEINFHYFLVIFFSNGKINCLNTPETVFKNYIVDKNANCDFGDKGEVVLFGKRVSELYINGVVNIMTLDLWNNNINTKPYIIGKKFLELNKETNNGEISIKNLINLSKFSENLYQKIKNEKDMEPFNLDSDIGDFFSRGKIIDMNIDEFDVGGKNFATIFPRGECLNVYRYYL